MHGEDGNGGAENRDDLGGGLADEDAASKWPSIPIGPVSATTGAEDTRDTSPSTDMRRVLLHMSSAQSFRVQFTPTVLPALPCRQAKRR